MVKWDKIERNTGRFLQWSDGLLTDCFSSLVVMWTALTNVRQENTTSSQQDRKNSCHSSVWAWWWGTTQQRPLEVKHNHTHKHKHIPVQLFSITPWTIFIKVNVMLYNSGSQAFLFVCFLSREPFNCKTYSTDPLGMDLFHERYLNEHYFLAPCSFLFLNFPIDRTH